MSDTYYIDILNRISFYLYGYGNLAICIVGNIGNLLSFIVFIKKSWKKNVCVFYFLIFLLVSTVDLNCVILGTGVISAYAVPTLLATILILASIDRLLISSQKVDTRLYSSKRLAYFSISISAFFWFTFNLHIAIKVNIQQVDPTDFICYYDLSKSYLDFVAYSSVTFNILFCLLMIILSVFSFKNVRRIRAVPRQQRNQIRSMTKKDFQLIRCLFVQDIVYICLNILANVYAVYYIATRNSVGTPLQEAIKIFLQNIFNFIYYTFYCTHFFIFFTVSKAFRQEIQRMIYKLFGKDLTALRREEQNQEDPVKDNVELNVVVPNIVLQSS